MTVAPGGTAPGSVTNLVAHELVARRARVALHKQMQVDSRRRWHLNLHPGVDGHGYVVFCASFV